MKKLISLIAIVSLVSCENTIRTTSTHSSATYKFKKKGVEYQVTRTYTYKVDTLKNN